MFAIPGDTELPAAPYFDPASYYSSPFFLPWIGQCPALTPALSSDPGSFLSLVMLRFFWSLTGSPSIVGTSLKLQITRSGYVKQFLAAEKYRELSIKKAAQLLEPLGVKASDITSLVEGCLKKNADM